MSKTPLLILLVLLPLLAGSVWWMARGSGAMPDPPGTSTESSLPASSRLDGENPDAERPPAEATGAPDRARVGAAAAPAGAVAPGYTGRVVDDSDNPVDGAVVELRRSTRFGPQVMSGDPTAMLAQARADHAARVEVVTDADGRFHAAAPVEADRISVVVRAPGFQVLRQSAPAPDGGDHSLGVLALSAGGVATGRVIDRAGSGIEGVRVERASSGRFGAMQDMQMAGMEDLDALRDDGRESAVTDAEGRFALNHLAPGEFSVRAKHRDYPTAVIDQLSIEAGGRLDNLVLVAEQGESVSGRVTDMPTDVETLLVLATRVQRENGNVFASMFAGGEHLADAGLPIGERWAEVGENGGFTLRGLAAGERYRIWGMQSRTGSLKASTCTPRVEVVAGTVGIELPYSAGVSVTFRVIDRQTGQPIERLWVRTQMGGGSGIAAMIASASASGSEARDYPGGVVTVDNLRPKKKQRLELTVEALGYQNLQREKIELPESGSLDLGTLQLDASPVLHVTVTSAADGEPVADATVSLREEDGAPGQQRSSFRGQTSISLNGMTAAVGGANTPRRATTDEKGQCTLNAPAGAAVRVSVGSDEFAPYRSDPITIRARGVTRHDAALLRGGSVDVLVLDQSGEPVTDISVRRADADGNHASEKVDGVGVARFRHLPPGDHHFKLAGSGGDRPFSISYRASMRISGATRSDNSFDPVAAGYESVHVAEGSTATLQLTKAPTATCTGIVRENGVPLSRATVTFVRGQPQKAEPGAAMAAELTTRLSALDNRGVNGRTDAEGRYQLEDVEAGEHRIRVTHRDRSMATELPVTLVAGANSFDVDLSTAVLRGTVRRGDGQPVRGARVSVAAAAPDTGEAGIANALAASPFASFMRGSSRRTDADGTFELRGVTAGVPLEVRVTGDKDWGPAKSAPVTVPVDGVIEGIEITVAGAGRIEVHASVEQPFAMVNASYEGEDPSSVAPKFGMLRDGVAKLEGLLPGRWKVALTGIGDGVDREPMYVQVEAGQTARVDF